MTKIQKATDLYEKGISYKEIARRLRVAPASAVAYVWKGRNPERAAQMQRDANRTYRKPMPTSMPAIREWWTERGY